MVASSLSLLLLLASSPATWAGDSGDFDYTDLLRDPVIYPPEIHESDPVTEGQVRVTREDGTGALILEHTSVVAEVHAGLARVTLTQWFHNPYDEPLEARYLFPLPDDSAVDRMDMVCGDRLVEGVIMEREAALRAYEEARDEGRKAALLEQERDNLFTQHIAGLCPQEEVQVTLQYVQQVEYEDGLYELHFPMTSGPRYSPPWVEDADRLQGPYTAVETGDVGERIHGVDITVYLEEGMPVASLWSDTHDIVVEEEGAWGAQVTLLEGVTTPDRDFSLSWALAGETPRAAVLAHRPRVDEPGYVAVTLEPQLLGDHFEARPRELLFVVDSSGSMQGEPYETARESVLLALEEMREGDRFNLVRFSNAASSLFTRPQPATAANRARAARWLTTFEGGGTEMTRGIVHSLDMPGDPDALRLVLMLTDGYVGNEKQIFETVRAHLGEARLFSLGVGSSPNRYLLEGLAEMGRGDVTFALPGTPREEVVEAFYGRIAHPAMSDINIHWGDLTVTGQYPEQIPDLWAGQPLRVVARYETDRSASSEGVLSTEVTVSGLVGREEQVLEYPLDLPVREPRHEAVASLWARRKIRDLTWYPGNRSPEELRAAVTAVALEHHLVSEYTSLVAIDEAPGACGPPTVTAQVPQAAPAGMAMLGAGGTSRGAGGKAMRGLGGLGLRGVGTGGGGGAALQGIMASSGLRAGSGYGGSSSQFDSKQAAVPRVQSAQTLVMGALDKSLVEKVIKRHLAPLRYCYQRQLQMDPDLAGEVVVKFVIDATGTVSDAEVKRTTLGNETVERCLVQRFHRMSFPAPAGGGIVIVSYPLVFVSQ